MASTVERLETPCLLGTIGLSPLRAEMVADATNASGVGP